ncbi:hypothetical protein FEDK69T_26100 [Flavobacterium enshiense DK69]|nr:hypothetical protein FEDK69T_26100 [Flavobacterium enshiense DK69]
MNVPPVPVNLVQVPPACSPVIKLNKSIDAVLESQIVVAPSTPAFGCGLILIVATLTSSTHGAIAVKLYWKVLVVVPGAGTKVPAAALNVPPVPVNLVQVPPACSPVIKPNKLIDAVLESQIVVAPSVPAFGCGLILTVATLTSLTHGAVPVIKYWKVLLVVPGAGTKVPAATLNVPPVPVNLVQVPPVCSPVIKPNKSIDAVLESQIVVAPSAPAICCGLILIVATLTSSIHGAIAVKLYWNVLVVVPVAATNVPVAALNVPPVPVNLVQVPPACSPVIKPNKSIDDVLESQIVVAPSVPAFGCALILIVATLTSSTHGVIAVKLYWNVLVVVPGAATKVPAAALNVPPVPVNLVQVPPACSPVIKLNKSIDAVLESQIVVAPSAPAFGCGLILIVATLTSLTHGAVPVIKYWKVLLVEPGAGT